MELDVWFHALSDTSMNNTRYPLDNNDDDDCGDDDKFGGRSLLALRYRALCFVWIYSYLLNETASAAAVKLI